MNQVTKLEEKHNVVAATPATLLEIAVNQGADIDRLEKLMELQQKWEQNEARKAYITAMNSFQSDCPVILKNKQGHNSSYATLAHTLETIQELLAEYGLSHSWKTEQHENNGITVTCCITHKMGHKECTSMFGSPDTSGSKNNIQAVGSTVSYLQRYTLYALLGLASKDMDNDGAGITAFITAEQLETIKGLMAETNTKESTFFDHYGIQGLSDLPKSKYQNALNLLNKKKAKQ